MDDLEMDARITRLEDEWEILKRLSEYAHAMDYGGEDAWLDCFTEDGIWDVRGGREGHPNRLFTGRVELGEFFRNRTRPSDLGDKHIAVEPLIVIDGDTATCASYMLVVREEDDGPSIIYSGRYLDTLVKESDGRWRFKHRIAEIESMRAGTAARSG
jgi:ketosteroid isomerase-like protein